jgi:uncharacterized membrane protein
MIYYNQIAGQNVKRIEALSDGVFAIALTILVLEIKVPDVHVHTEKELFQVIVLLAPKFLSYFLSFMTMGIFWTGQSLQLSYVENYNRDLNWNSLFFLLLVSLLPFTTAFLGEYIEFRLAIGLYWLNIFLLGFLLYIHWVYAFKNKFISLKGDELEAIDKAIRRRIIIAQVLYLFGALLSFINSYVSIGFIILVQLNYAFAFFSPRIPKKIKKQRIA